MDIREDDKFGDLVSNALEKQGEFRLPHSFADRVINAVQAKAALKEAKRDRWWLIVGVVGMVAALIYAMVAVEFKPGVGVFTFFQGYWGLITFGVLFVIALHVIDKRLQKKQESG
jgi:hypothetical protein